MENEIERRKRERKSVGAAAAEVHEVWDREHS